LTVSLTSKALRQLSREEAFYFFVSVGNYLGENAASLGKFIDKLKEINIVSLEFHLYRRDFEKWIDKTIGDKVLTKQIMELRSKNLRGTTLRDQLYTIISKRLKKLKAYTRA